MTVTDAPVDGIDVTMPYSPHISGRVTDPDGQPLPEIFVGVDSDGFGTFTFTDEDGAYRLTVLPGTYTVSFHDDNKVYLGGCYADEGITTDPNACSLVEVDGVDERELNVAMPVARRIIGRVVGPDGLPLVNIGVNADTDALANDMTTEEGGDFLLLVVPGAYQVNFRDESPTHVAGCYGDGGFSAGSAACTLVPVTEADTDVDLGDITMPVGLHIEGTVQDPDGTLLPNIPVMVRDAGNYLVWSSTGLYGEYSVAVVPGEYTVWFYDESGAYAQGCYSSGSVDSSGAACTPVSLPPDPAQVDVTLPLAPQP